MFPIFVSQIDAMTSELPNTLLLPLLTHSQILERDEEGKDKAPEIIKEEIDSTKASSTSKTKFKKNEIALAQMENIAKGGHGLDPVEVGHKFGLPDLPIPPRANLHHRYDPVVSQVTNLLMRHGKLSVAQRVGSSVPLLSFCLQCYLSCKHIPNGLRPRTD